MGFKEPVLLLVLLLQAPSWEYLSASLAPWREELPATQCWSEEILGYNCLHVPSLYDTPQAPTCCCHVGSSEHGSRKHICASLQTGPASPWDGNILKLDSLGMTFLDIELSSVRIKFELSLFSRYAQLFKTEFQVVFCSLCKCTNVCFQIRFIIIYCKTCIGL